MKLPGFLRIGHYRWRLVRSNLADHDEAGYCLTDKHEIGVAKEGDLAGDDEEASTLVHEWIHGLIHIHFPEIEDDEALTQKLELIVMQTLRDNKTAVRAILKSLK
jgi:hypothetical protein